jgi:hypothetical protein
MLCPVSCILCSLASGRVLRDEEEKRQKNRSARNMGVLYLLTALVGPCVLAFFLGARTRSYMPEFDVSVLPSWLLLVLTTLANICDSVGRLANVLVWMLDSSCSFSSFSLCCCGGLCVCVCVCVCSCVRSCCAVGHALVCHCVSPLHVLLIVHVQCFSFFILLFLSTYVSILFSSLCVSVLLLSLSLFLVRFCV